MTTVTTDFQVLSYISQRLGAHGDAKQFYSHNIMYYNYNNKIIKISEEAVASSASMVATALNVVTKIVHIWTIFDSI